MSGLYTWPHCIDFIISTLKPCSGLDTKIMAMNPTVLLIIVKKRMTVLKIGET